MSVKKKKNLAYQIYNVFSLGKMAGETDPFTCRKVKYQLVVKCSENLAIEKMCCNFE